MQTTAMARVGMASYNGESQKKVDACRNHRISKATVLRVSCKRLGIGLGEKQRDDMRTQTSSNPGQSEEFQKNQSGEKSLRSAIS